MRRLLLPLLSVLACSADPVAAPVPGRTAKESVHVAGAAFRDGQGRQLLFRGYNAKVDGIFDVKFGDGRAPNYVFESFDEAAAARFEELGVDVLRLPVNWSALEPAPRVYADAFFAKVDGVLDMAKRHHFWVLLDMHQDAYSKEIGEDGAPLWAIVPPPPKLLGGPSDDSRRFSQPVLEAGFDFFDDLPATDGRSLQDAFIAAVETMARRYLGRPEVLGFEAFNEPIVLSQSKLDAFHARFADRLHAIDRDAPILFEPISTRNQNDHALLASEPWSHGPGVYAPHVYTGWFSVPSQNDWASEDPATLAPSMEAADQEARAWSTPLFVTEFGCDQSSARGPKWLAAELDLQDRFLTSSTSWIWEEKGSWGAVDANRVERDATTRVMARPYPRAVAGDLLSIERPDPSRLVVHYRATAATRGLPHEVSASSAYFVDFKTSCDGAEVPAERAPGRAAFACPATDGEHTFEVQGTLR
ncbi:MAG TPA: cellulase family glycosylhydrolase [Polyangiaceae bacterium]